jgi:argininosuccinate lyase
MIPLVVLLCTGSSIMPQKINPDILELTRAKSSVVVSNSIKIKMIIQNLISGYNRDFQLTKEPLMESFGITLNTISIMYKVVEGLKIDEEKCKKDFTPDVFATDYANKLVKEGIPFRDAYKKTAADIEKLKNIDPIANIKSKKHKGATGNLGLDKI